jgi:hydroxysqualene dehydroxylase
MATVHVVGAGLAGLACAVRLAGRGRQVVVHEAAPQAGGRCRSYFDRTLGRRIDNGNHLLLSGNRDALAYLEAIGARDSLIGPPEPAFPFLDLESGARWTVRPNRGRLPWWLLVPSRRVPGTRPSACLEAWRLARAGPEATLAQCLDPAAPSWRAFWDPLATAILNTPASEGSARLLWAALRESFALGGAGCRPLIARDGLSESLVDPALGLLERHGARVALGHRLRRIERRAERVERLEFDAGDIELVEDDLVVLALPPAPAKALLPEIEAPEAAHAIVNAHFVLEASPSLPEASPLLGLVGATAQWIFVRGPLVSLTVSAADALAEQPGEAIAEVLWQDTARALGLPAGRRPPVRIVKEKRATFAQTPQGAACRPQARTRWPNLLLAGDWTATGLPATIEGAVRSGHHAAALALNGSLSSRR